MGGGGRLSPLLGFRTLHLGFEFKNNSGDESIMSPLELANSATASADFLVFFPQFFSCSTGSPSTLSVGSGFRGHLVGIC